MGYGPRMTEENPTTRLRELLSLSNSHGLELREDTVQLEEAGLDYRVAFATDVSGTQWVLRIPRRADVSAKIEEEARLLAFLAPRLSVAIPDWKVQSADLLAYPRLPGAPGLTLDPETKAPRFHVDPTSEAYAASLGRVIAELHRIDPEEARAAGVPHQSPEEVRQAWAENFAKVRAAFTLSPKLEVQWRGRLDDDAMWPVRTVMTHGELYAAHTLVDAQSEVRSVLDWTTAKVGDPAVDFAYQHLMAGPSFAVTERAYQEAGGEALSGLAARCAAIMGAGPLNYGLFALTSGEAEHRDAAAAMLNPPE